MSGVVRVVPQLRLDQMRTSLIHMGFDVLYEFESRNLPVSRFVKHAESLLNDYDADTYEFFTEGSTARTELEHWLKVAKAADEFITLATSQPPSATRGEARSEVAE